MNKARMCNRECAEGAAMGNGESGWMVAGLTNRRAATVGPTEQGKRIEQLAAALQCLQLQQVRNRACVDPLGVSCIPKS